MNYFILKIIALITMTIDHIGIVLLNNNIYCRLIGRLSFPLYCLLIVNGFYHTSNCKKYLSRLFMFALISELPFDLAFNTNFLDSQNIFFTLTFGLLLITLIDTIYKKNINVLLKFLYISILVFIISFINEIMRNDYGWFGIILIFIFYICYGNKNINKIYLMLGLAVVNILYFIINKNVFELMSILDVIFIILFENKTIKKNKTIKTICYFYYPVHLLILFFIKYLFF